jgi:DNA invertase Pin-like site-specific DNA recombinase
MTRKPRLRCAIYTRKSSEEGLDQPFNSLQAQREASEAYIKSQTNEGWVPLPTLYDDGGFSGGSMERPALQRLLADIAMGLIDTVVVYKVDRLTRSLSDFARMVEIFDGQGVSFVSVTQQFNTTTSMGRLTLNVLLSFAQFEREVTGERIRDKFAASKRKGMWMGGFPSLGYDVVDRKLVVNEPEAETVRLIFERYVRLGCVARLAKSLRQDGIVSKRWQTQAGATRGGANFARGALYHLLQNRIYLGLIIHKADAHPGQHEPIVPQDLWDRVQARLAGNRQAADRETEGTPVDQPLIGRLFDDRGNRMSPVHARKKNGIRYRYYVSQALLASEPDRAGSVARVSAPEIEGIVEQQIIQLLPHPEQRAWARQDLAERVSRLRAIAQRVVIRQDAVEIGVDEAALCPAQTTDRRPSQTPDRDPHPTRTISVPVRVRTRGRAKNIETASGRGSILASRLDRSLIRGLVRAHHWRERLKSGEANSTFDLARQEGCHVRYIRNILKLAFLAPDIAEATLDGRQPAHLALADLIRAELPDDWSAQRRLLGFHA